MQYPTLESAPFSTHPMKHSGPISKVLTGLSLFVGVCAVAVAGYVASGAEIADSIYMVIITIFGVGYEEKVPIDTPERQVLTILVIVAGYVAVIYTIGGFMQLLIDGELNKALGARRMTKEIERMEDHTIICGIGRMGSILARELANGSRSFLVIDCDERRLKQAEELGYCVLCGDATEEEVLEKAGIHRATTLATVLSDDAKNVFVTITARAMNSELHIIARGENPRTEKKLIGCGANNVVLPTAIGAFKVAQLVTRPSAERFLEQMTDQSQVHDELNQIGLQFDDLKVHAESPLANRALSEIEVQSNHGFLIVGIRHADGSISINPSAQTRLQAGDTVIVLGHDDDIPQLAARFTSTKPKITYRGATAEA